MHNRPQGKPHYIPEWAEHRGYDSQAKLRRELEAIGLAVDKSTISRWYKGGVPQQHHQNALAALFGLESNLSLFRDPYDDWMADFFANRSEEEKERMKRMLELAFPKAS